MSRDYSAVMPSGVMVVFQGRRCSGLVSDTVPSYYTKTVSIADAGITPGQSGFSGTQHFRDDALALYNVGGGNPTNQTALDALSLQIAKDYYRWRSVAFDVVYNGVVAPDMNGLMDEIEWAYDMEDCHTRMFTGPYDGEPEELHHWDPATAGCVDVTGTGLVVDKTPCLEYYGPPALCASGNLQLTRYKLCLIDGRLQSTYVQRDSTT